MDEDVMGLHAAEPREVLGVNASPHRPDARGVTPGPWESAVWDYVSRDEAVEHFRFMLDQHGDALPRLVVTVNDELTIGIVGNGPASQANARLIAAAPDLYEAVLLLIGEGGPHYVCRGLTYHGRPGCSTCGPARAALARVTGEAIPSTPSTSSPRTAKQTQKES